jgi:hypothetical protein
VEDEVLKKVALISVEEHVDNCATFLGFVSPEADPILTNALFFHDIGKKLFRIRAIYRDAGSAALRKWGWDLSQGRREDVVKLLKRDYAATMCPGLEEPISDGVPISEVADAYLSFVGLKEPRQKEVAEGVKAYSVRNQPDDQRSQIAFASYRLDRPFGNHAAPVKTEHLPEGLENRERLAGLIRLHHGFQVSKIIPEAAVWGAFPEVLYALMTMDHLGSSWAERLVLLEEGGSKRPFERGVDFGEIESWMENGLESETNPDGTKTVSTRVHLRRQNDHEDVVSFSVTYFAREVNYVDPSLRT